MKIVIDCNGSPSMRRAARMVALIGAVCVGGVALAGPTKVFVAGESLKAADLNASFDELRTRATALESALGPSGSLDTKDAALSGDLTVAGVTDVGLRAQKNCTYVPNSGSSYTDCTCGAEEVAIAGGAFCNNGTADGILMESRNAELLTGAAPGPTWRVACIDLTTHARFAGAYPFALCARLKSN